MSDRPYLSIGEVLGLLLEEFPDVTISKIRFLESQGLIDPERTPSGYRKFYDGDVERLRMILREQRENFLPLKVIRDRLERGAIEGEGAGTPPRGIRNVTVLPVADDGRETAMSRQHPSAQLRLAEPVPTTAEPPLAAEELLLAPPEETSPAAGERAASGPGGPGAPSTPGPVVPATPSAPGAPSGPATPSGPAAPAAGPLVTASVPTSSEETGLLATAPAGDETTPLRPPPTARPGGSRETYSASEVCSIAGIDTAQLAEIQAFGLITPRGSGEYAIYADTDLAIACASAGFLHRGVEGRHLRAWRQAAEREAALFEQLILPQLRARNPQARQQAVETLRELARLGGELRNALVAAALRHHIDP